VTGFQRPVSPPAEYPNRLSICCTCLMPEGEISSGTPMLFWAPTAALPGSAAAALPLAEPAAPLARPEPVPALAD
jgi:hypothetical protein